MKQFISNLFRLPVTRVEILTYAKRLAEKHPDRYLGLCLLIQDSLRFYGITTQCYTTEERYYFPLYTRQNAFCFGATKDTAYWWHPCQWNTGRMDFLDWLIEQYKDDKTNLRKL